MKIRHLAVVATLAASGSAFAVDQCSPASSFSLGTMGPPATKTFGNSFAGSTTFKDCYDFSIASPATATGTTTESNALFFGLVANYIDVLTVKLFNSVSGLQVGLTDATPNQFSFTNLAAGAYELVVSGFAADVNPLTNQSAKYSGTLTTASTSVASPVPEAPLTAMLALALAGAALVARRKRG
jgi:hypothetical protein